MKADKPYEVWNAMLNSVRTSRGIENGDETVTCEFFDLMSPEDYGKPERMALYEWQIKELGKSVKFTLWDGRVDLETGQVYETSNTSGVTHCAGSNIIWVGLDFAQLEAIMTRTDLTPEETLLGQFWMAATLIHEMAVINIMLTCHKRTDKTSSARP